MEVVEKEKKGEIMCFKKYAIPVVTGNNIALTYNINNYIGSENDLNGCISDGKNLDKFLLSKYPRFKTTKVIDSEVTRKTFHDLTKNTIVSAVSGDTIIIHYSGHGSYGTDPRHPEKDGYSECLYLYDGPFWDYEFAEILALIPDGVKVIIILDSCFSFGATTKHLGNPVRNFKSRFIQFQDLDPNIPKRKSALLDENLKHILMAGCQERQTSADCYLSGVGYVGAFTYFLLMKAWRKEYTYNQWIDETIYMINKAGFEQVPGILGNQSLINQVILT